MTKRPGLSGQIETLFKIGREDGFTLPGNVLSKTIKIEAKSFHAVYSEARDLRNNPQKLLEEHGITLPAKPPYHELILPADNRSKKLTIIPESTYQKLSLTKQKKTRIAWPMNADQNLLGISLSGYKNKQEFYIGANFVPFGQNHLLVWNRSVIGNNGEITTLRQTYHGLKFLYWVDDLMDQINDPEYRFFYNAIGTGNSSDILHFQGMKEKFPAFAYLSHYYHDLHGIIFTSRRAWPFKGILARYTEQTKANTLAELNNHCQSWLRKNPKNTFNLLAQRRENKDGQTINEIFFIKRKSGLYNVAGMSNEFSGAEVGGRIGMTNRTEYDNFQNISHFQWDESRLP